jgi:hypothetical protein
MRSQRDALNVVFFIFGLMREVPEIVGALRQAGVEEHLKTKESWNKLLGLRTRWKGQGLQSDFRNKLAFHFDPGLTTEGLNLWCVDSKGFPLTIAQGDSRREIDTSFPIGLELVSRALGLDPSSLMAFAAERKDDHYEFARNVQDVFFQVVDAKVSESRRTGSCGVP